MEKITIDDYPSVNEYFDTLIANQDLFEEEVCELDESQLIAFYEHVLNATNLLEDKPENKDNPIWYVKSYLEDLEVIQSFLSESVFPPLSQEEQDDIDKTIRLLEERRRQSPLKRLIKYLKN